MAIFLDDEAAPFEADNVGTALAAAKRTLAPEGRVVVEVRLGDEPLTGDTLADHHEQPIGDNELRLYSADPKSLAIETLEQVRTQLLGARATLEQASDMLQRDEPAGAMGKVAETIAVWLQTQQAIQHGAALVGVDLDDIRVDGATVDGLTQDLTAQLKTLRDLLQSKDMVGLADALAYEWPEQADQWDRLIAALIGHMET